VAPVKLVLDAGGAARAFSRPEEHGDGPTWVERNLLVIDSYNFLVTGNGIQTGERLAGILTAP
jgi:hypothetical protein